jgi:hypothetical protein
MKKKSKVKIIKNGKKRGEWAELVFAARAVRQGLPLSKPWGESSGYDFAVEQESGRIVRVQVKSTIAREGDGYTCCLKDSRGPYRGNKFDFVAAYVIPEDLWYIVPAKVVKGQWSMGLHPELEVSKYGKYEEAWHLLWGRKKAGVVGSIEACAEGGEAGV